MQSLIRLHIRSAFELNCLQVAVDSMIEQQADLLTQPGIKADERADYEERKAAFLSLKERLAHAGQPEPLGHYPPHAPDRYISCDGAANKDLANGDRACKAEAAFMGDGFPMEDEDYSDLISNLLHLAHREDHNPEAILRMAEMNFENEAGHL